MTMAQRKQTPFQIQKHEPGMSVLELVISVALFAAFMGVFVAVTEVMGRYAQDGGPGDQTEPARNLIEDQHYLHQAMDDLAERISQPALSDLTVQEIAKPSTTGKAGNCSYDPVAAWNLTGRSQLRGLDSHLRSNYQFCLHATSLAESKEEDLLDKNISSARPGFFVITAIPDQVSINKQPARRLVCRPSPFCS